MIPYSIIYALGGLIPLLGFFAFLVIIIYLIVQRVNEKQRENFEDRDN